MYSGIGQQFYQFLRDILRMKKLTDVRSYEEDVYGETYIVTFMKIYYAKFNTRMKVSN